MYTKIAEFPNRQSCKLSIIVACYNEDSVIEEFHKRVINVLQGLPFASEILYINDGSKDKTPIILSQLSNASNVYCINLSRNFGKEAAMKAGIDSAKGSAVIFIDADLQDPPELISDMVSAWMSGYDIVNMQRSKRSCDSYLKRITANLYYRTMSMLSDGNHFPDNVSDYRLLGPRPLAALRSMPEKKFVLKNMINWLGFNTVEIPYERENRFAGNTKWGYLKLIKLALDSIFSFSTKPLRYFTALSLAALTAALIIIIISAYLSNVTLVHILLLFIALVSVGISIVGEYLAIILSETKNRPHYFISTNNTHQNHYLNNVKRIVDRDE